MQVAAGQILAVWSVCKALSKCVRAAVVIAGALSLLLLQVVLQVKAAVEQLQPGTTYNSCLLNLYRDGSHHVSWHADNEKL
jgi:hypothetical protein